MTEVCVIVAVAVLAVLGFAVISVALYWAGKTVRAARRQAVREREI